MHLSIKRACFSTASTDLLITSILILTCIPQTTSIPHPAPASTLSLRQTSISNLALPKCALPCFINSLTDDGCPSETDFKCHCEKGTVLSSASDCLKKGCDADDQKKAVDQVQSACKAAGASPGGDGGDDQGSSSKSEETPSSTAVPGDSSTAGGNPSRTMTSNPKDTAAAPTSSSPSSANPNPSDTGTSNPTQEPAPTPSAPTGLPSQSAQPSSKPSSTGKPPMPTDTPLALLPTDRQLSPGAKAGISLSVTIFASAILVTIALYIRRLKRDLRAAKAAAGVPESVWRAHISTAAAPGPISRRRSWRGSRRGRSPPGSPLSPDEMRETGDGVLKKKGRGHVLSVVVERVEEEDSASVEKMIHEPVPGQKEGLVDPLELDGDATGIVELPTSITPRTRSRERTTSRERGSSFGESSRPRGSSFGDASRPTTGERGRYMM